MKKYGFTLIEVIFALAILTIALVGLIGVFTTCMRLDESSRNITTATAHARCVMEEIRDINVSNIVTATDWTSWAAAEHPAGGSCNTLDDEVVQVTYPAGTTATPLEILVTVNWTERSRSRNSQLVTLFSER